MDGQNFPAAPAHRHRGQDPVDPDRCTYDCPYVAWLARRLGAGSVPVGPAVMSGSVGSGVDDGRLRRPSWAGIDGPLRYE